MKIRGIQKQTYFFYNLNIFSLKGKIYSDLKFAVEFIDLFSEMLGFFMGGGYETFLIVVLLEF